MYAAASIITRRESVRGICAIIILKDIGESHLHAVIERYLSVSPTLGIYNILFALSEKRYILECDGKAGKLNHYYTGDMVEPLPEESQSSYYLSVDSVFKDKPKPSLKSAIKSMKLW